MNKKKKPSAYSKRLFLLFKKLDYSWNEEVDQE